jgi:transposase
MMTREEIAAVYESGPEAVVVLVQTLLHSHEQQINALNARITELENRLSKDSHNSHKPPASDGLGKKTKKKTKSSSLRRKTGKQPGGQPGHPGTTLDLVDHPDHVIEHQPSDCSGCGTSLYEAPTTTSSGFERRQVHEAPPLKLVVTEHRALSKVCPACKSTTSGAFPEGVSSRVQQYGERLKAIGVYLQEYQLLPFWRAHEVLFFPVRKRAIGGDFG